MANPTLGDLFAGLANIKEFIDTLFTKLETATPEALRAGEEALRLKIVAAIDSFDLPAVEQSIAEVFDTIRNMRGPLGPGLDVDEAGP